MSSHYKIKNILLIFNCYYFYPFLGKIMAEKEASNNTVYAHFFYDTTGILNINGSVPGNSGPITLDMKPRSDSCTPTQYFVFSYCANRRRLAQEELCEEGLNICYDGRLVDDKITLSEFRLDYVRNEVWRKCDKIFSGFKVALVKRRQSKDDNKSKKYFQIRTTFLQQSHFYEMPPDGCFDIWMGGKGGDLLTRVRNRRGQQLWPVQIIFNGTTNQPEGFVYPDKKFPRFPDVFNGERFMQMPDLQMLFLDFRSDEFNAQKVFTVAPGNGSVCNLLVQVRSNTVGTCKAVYRQKTIALGAATFGETKFSLTLETGIETQSRHKKSTFLEQMEEEIYDRAWEQERDDYGKHGIQASDEKVQEIKNEKVIKDEKKENIKDNTPFWKKAFTTVINTGLIFDAACTAVSIKTAGHVTCDAKLEMKDGEIDRFNEKITSTDIHKTTTTNTRGTAQSKQSTLAKSFERTESTSQKQSQSTTEERTVTVNARTVFRWTIKVPPGKVITPLQKVFDCDHNRVPIPWMKFVISDKDEKNGAAGFVEDYDQNDEGPNKRLEGKDKAEAGGGGNDDLYKDNIGLFSGEDDNTKYGGDSNSLPAKVESAYPEGLDDALS